MLSKPPSEAFLFLGCLLEKPEEAVGDAVLPPFDNLWVGKNPGQKKQDAGRENHYHQPVTSRHSIVGGGQNLPAGRH